MSITTNSSKHEEWWAVLAFSGSFLAQGSHWIRKHLFSCSVMSDSLRCHGLQHARLSCPAPSPRACSNSCSLSPLSYLWTCLASFPGAENASFLLYILRFFRWYQRSVASAWFNHNYWASLIAQLVKNLPTMPTVRETWVQTLGWEDPWRKKRLPTPVFWPGELHGLYSPWCHKESDRTEQLSL